ncbi:uncharacterized protein LOC111089018 [Limulus polyphemus]|uniref:Uncharacterized protein LOC111089018 n=1 Tax=Limulus polyphemus TaxID=6850 RepID=A0ABM1TKB3_LIMPO|nr:uncharacterized protein LOC111089018 [Limulus polyphemus]
MSYSFVTESFRNISLTTLSVHFKRTQHAGILHLRENFLGGWHIPNLSKSTYWLSRSSSSVTDGPLEVQARQVEIIRLEVRLTAEPPHMPGCHHTVKAADHLHAWVHAEMGVGANGHVDARRRMAYRVTKIKVKRHMCKQADCDVSDITVRVIFHFIFL